MKRAIYLTKTKVIVAGKSFDWVGNDLVKIFKGIRSDERVKDVRIVLGDDVSFVTSFKNEDDLSRDKIEILTRGSMPFTLEEKCFDYRIVSSVGGEDWVQAVAVENYLLEAVSLAVWESGLSAELMIPVGVLIGEKSAGRETPIIIKWSGFENLSVIAVNGLTDSVYTNESDEALNAYAKSKWNLAVDLEQMLLDDKSFNVEQEAFKEKNRGGDETVLNIPVLKKQEIATEEINQDAIPDITQDEKNKRPLSKTTMLLIGVLILSLSVMIFVLVGAAKPKVVNTPVAPVVSITTSPSATPTAVVQKVDLNVYKVQVLNGSGVTGEAGKIKELLLAKGFVNIDTGNTTATTLTLISHKTDLHEQALSIVKENVTAYKLGNIGVLTSSDKYDLVIVLGSEKN